MGDIRQAEGKATGERTRRALREAAGGRGEGRDGERGEGSPGGHAGEGATITLTRGPGPLRAARAEAAVRCRCRRCGADDRQTLVVGADWLDRDAVARQREHATGLRCRRCGAGTGLPVPLVQYRHLDAPGFLVCLPAPDGGRRADGDRAPGRRADGDRRWVAAVVRALGAHVEAGAATVAVGAAAWPSVDTVPLGPVLAGLAEPPALPGTPEEAAAWLAEARRAVRTPDVGGGLGRFLTAADGAAAAVLAAEPLLTDPRWRTTVELGVARVADDQETAERRAAVAHRLDRLRRYAIDREPPAGRDGDGDCDGDGVPAGLADDVRRAAELDAGDPDRPAALTRVTERLAAHGPTRALARMMTALVAARLADPGRTSADDLALEEVAREAVSLSARMFGAEHPVTISNELNRLLVRAGRWDLQADDLATLTEEYRWLATSPAVRRHGHLVGVLVNLAVATERRGDLDRGDRQEVMLGLLEDARHVAVLTQPYDVRTLVFCLGNTAAVLRQRVAGVRRRNAERALALLDQAWALERRHGVLHLPERVQLAINRLDAAVTVLRLGGDTPTVDEVVAAASDVTESAATLDPAHALSVPAAVAAGAALLQLHRRERDRALWDAAAPLLASAHLRARRDHAPGIRVRLAAAAALAALYGSVVDGEVVDADRSAALLVEIAREAANVSPDHAASAWANLALLRSHQGRWDDAARHYGEARRARRADAERLPGRRPERQPDLSGTATTGDLAAHEAFAHARAGHPDDAVAALEDGLGDARPGRRSAGRPVGRSGAAGEAGRTVVHLASSGSGTVAVVSPAQGPRVREVSALTSGEVAAGLAALAGATTRAGRVLALEALSGPLAGLVGAVAALVGDDTRELCVVACGPLAGVPLAAIRNRDGVAWSDRWPVRHWPSARQAAGLRRPDLARPWAGGGGGPAGTGVRAVAVAAGPDRPLAASELDAVTHLAGSVSTPDPGWAVVPWLRAVLPRADLVHLACPVRIDPGDPTGSWFEFVSGERLGVADLIDGADARHLQLVVASGGRVRGPVPGTPGPPDGFLGLGTGLLQAGVQAVISTLWEVDEVPAALLVARFYEGAARGHEPAFALHRAQRWLAGVGNAELAALCAARLDPPDDDDPAAGPGTAAWLPRPLAERLAPDVASADPAARPFRHPVDWAAFTYLGA